MHFYKSLLGALILCASFHPVLATSDDPFQPRPKRGRSYEIHPPQLSDKRTCDGARASTSSWTGHVPLRFRERKMTQVFPSLRALCQRRVMDLLDQNAPQIDRENVLFPLLFLPDSPHARFLYGAMECHGLEAGPITPFVQTLTLNCPSDANISEKLWPTVAFFTNVRRLRAMDLGEGWQEFPSLGPLVTLTTLESLTLVDSNLGFRKNPLTPLSHLEELYSLVLNKNRLGLQEQSLAPLSPLTRLEVLSLSDNALRGTHVFEALNHLTHLTRLNLNNNNIGKAPDELRPIATLSRLKTLSLKHNRLGARAHNALVHLAALPVLEDLNLRDNRLGSMQACDLTPVSRLTSLLNLNLKNNSLGGHETDLHPLADLTRLHVLNLAGNKLATCPGALLGIKNLLSIGTLHLDYNTFKNAPPLVITPLTGLGRLRVLTLRKNGLGRTPESLSPLRNLFHLRHLDLAYNDLGNCDKSLDPLSGLISLNTLDISFNGFGYYPGEFMPLTSLKNLESLHIKSRENGPHFIVNLTQAIPSLMAHLVALDATTHLVALHSWARRTRALYPLVKITV